MEKIKFDFKNVENKVVKFQGQKIEIKPYIEMTNVVNITSICLKQFFNAETDVDYSMLPLALNLFDVLVVNACTNIDVQGVKNIVKGKQSKLEVNIGECEINKILSSGIIDLIKSNVLNYDGAREQLIKSIELWNINLSIIKLIKSMPTVEDLINDIESLSEDLAEVKKNHSDTLNKFIEPFSNSKKDD